MFPGAIPTLTDGVVTLRAHRPSDAQGALEQADDADSVRWTRVPWPCTMEDAVEFVTSRAVEWAEDREWSFAIEFDGEYAGSISLRNEGDHRAEVAYGSHPRVRGVKVEGHTVLERAVRLLLEWGFAELELRTVIWWAHVGNWASRKLAWKLGFSLDGTVRAWLEHRGEYRDAWVGTLLAGEPLSPRGPWAVAPPS